MPQLSELSDNGGGMLHDALAAGIADISQQTTVCFTLYHKVVLPLDGFVFWLRANSFEYSGSIHWLTEREQEESETRARNTVLFTTTEIIQQLNFPNTQTLAVGFVEGRPFAFGGHNWYHPQAGIWHYRGQGVSSLLDSQLINDPAQLDPTQLIVSNSLPAWLQLVSYDPVWISWPVDRNPHITLYPSYLVPDNISPPYGVVHIEPARIEALQSTAMWMTPTFNHYQLTREEVRVTLYGLNNSQAADWLDLVEQYTLDTDAFGLMNMPTIRDGKKLWLEGMVVAQQKFIDFEVSYIQTRINEVARQLILDAQATVLVDDAARTAGELDAQGDIQTGPLTLIASMVGEFDASAGFSAAPQALGTNNIAETDAAAGISAYAAVAMIAPPATMLAQAGMSGVLSWPAMAAAAVGATAGIGGSFCIVASATATLNASTAIQATDSVRKRLAATASASAATTAAPAVAAAAGAELDAAGRFTAYANTIGLISAEISGAPGISGDANPLTTPVGTSWFLTGEMDAAAGMSSTANIRASSAGTVAATTSVNGSIILALWGLARVAGAAGMSGNVQHLTLDWVGETDAVAWTGATAQISAVAAGEVDAAAGINGNVLRVRYASGEVDATGTISAGRMSSLVNAPAAVNATAGIAANPLRVTFAAGQFNATAGISSLEDIIVGGDAARIDASAGISGAISVFTFPSGRVDAAAGIVLGPSVLLANTIGEIDGAAGISGTPALPGRAFVAGEIDAAAGLIGNALRVTFAGAEADAAASTSLGPSVLRASASGVISAGASISGAIVVREALSGTVAASASVSGAVILGNPFSPDFSPDFGPHP